VNAPDPQVVREFLDDMATRDIVDTDLDRMTPQTCPAGVHTDWAVDGEHGHACPWCENADLRAKLAAAVRVVSTAYPTTPDELTAVIRQIGEITHVPAETVTVWSGYDDDERGFPLFTTREQAQAYAEQQFRKDCVNWGHASEDIGEITWVERKAYTDAHDGRAGLFDLNCAIGGDGYVVCERTVYASAEAALLAETAEKAPLGARVRIDRSGSPFNRMDGIVTVLHPYGEVGKVGVALDGREGVAVFPADDVEVLAREADGR
jgi:hypothetical protein